MAIADIADLPELVIPAKSERYQNFSIACLINNEKGYSCSRNEKAVANHTPPFPLLRVEAVAGGRFEVSTSGPDMDRGALLGSYSVTLLTGVDTEELTREMNGGRPF